MSHTPDAEPSNGTPDWMSTTQDEVLARYTEGGTDGVREYLDELNVEESMVKAVRGEAETIGDEGIQLQGLIPDNEVKERVQIASDAAKDHSTAMARRSFGLFLLGVIEDIEAKKTK